MIGTNRTRFLTARIGRRLVQLGFLAIFLYPLGISLYQRISYSSVPTFTSWLLIWDPLLILSQAISQKQEVYIIGMPLFILSATLLFGRSFCGWVCPLGTLVDLVRLMSFWKHKPGQKHYNSRVRYYLLAGMFLASIYSLKLLGILDPLVIINRASISLASNSLTGNLPGYRATLSIGFLVFMVILSLEFWQPRLWCRSLCPVGALLSIISRFSILRRWVRSERCSGCGRCSANCDMNALENNGIVNDYAHCTFCLECQSHCSRHAIQFAFFRPGDTSIQSTESYLPHASATTPPSHESHSTRRAFFGTIGAGVVSLGLSEALHRLPSRPALRPPGALPEAEFLRTCILCQECIRVCPTGGLQPAFLENGLTGVGAPILVPRHGGCALNPSCPHLCSRVCPVGAIKPVSKIDMKIGVASVDRSTCLAWDQGAKCLVCVEACLNSAAIPFHGRVTIDTDRCTGCGRCESGCPVPGSAIHVKPNLPSLD